MSLSSFFFFFNDTPTTEIYTLSLHDALPISWAATKDLTRAVNRDTLSLMGVKRSEEHTSELQSLTNLVCRLLLEKKKKEKTTLTKTRQMRIYTEIQRHVLLRRGDDHIVRLVK